ncbi:MAG: Pyruvate carboxyl transferase [Myxococcaceae bacterium]|nr:Pyruvate carboxyl transferase [Myxococcaceae bacterium]
MRYYVTLDPNAPADSQEAKPIEVDVTELPNGELDVLVGGKRVDVDVTQVADQLSMRIDGRIIGLTTEGAPPDLGIIASGHRSYVRVVSDRQRAAEAAKKGKTSTEKTLKSPMPGRVVKLLVAVGDAVVVGQPILVVEAMKMENELKSKIVGTVAELHVTAGTAVESNAKLVTFA